MTADPYVASVQIAADPDRVFDYFTDSDALTRWMGRRAVLDPRPGGEFTLDIHRINVRGRYLEVDRPRRLVISWGHEGSEILPPGASTVEVSFVPHAGGTLVQVVHRDLPDVEAPQHALGWPHFLERLVHLGEGEDPGPDPWLATPPSFPAPSPAAMEDAVDSIAERTRFSGVVRVERPGIIELSRRTDWPTAATRSPTPSALGSVSPVARRGSPPSLW